MAPRPQDTLAARFEVALPILPFGREFRKITAMRNFPRLAITVLALVLPLSAAWAQRLDCQPCNNHYGRVQIGTSVQRLIQLKNVGTKSLRIRAKAITGSAFTFGNFPLPVNIGAGKSIKMPINFAPKVVGQNTGKITLTSNARNSKFVINVYGVGVAAGNAHLTVTPASLDFGSVTVGSSASLAVTLSATGAPVTITAAQSNSSEFTLPGLTLPLTVAVGHNAQVTVRFKPNASGTASGKLTLTSDADNSPSSVSMTGVGVAAGSHSADLTWDPSKDTVIGYNVYRGGTKGGPYTQINGALNGDTNYTDNTVKGGTTYFFVVTAVNAENQESGPSNEVKVIIPSP
jgi:centrosomal CEP192-like protein/ASPM-SPD-2-Hydin domain-containing protein